METNQPAAVKVRLVCRLVTVRPAEKPPARSASLGLRFAKHLWASALLTLCPVLLHRPAFSQATQATPSLNPDQKTCLAHELSGGQEALW